MTNKTILTLIGTVLGVQSIAVFVGAEAITTQAFAALSPDATGIQIGSMLHEVVAVVNMMVAIILLSARNLEQAAASKILMGTAIGLLVMLSHGYYNLFATQVKPPLPLLIVMTILMGLAFASARRK